MHQAIAALEKAVEDADARATRLKATRAEHVTAMATIDEALGQAEQTRSDATAAIARLKEPVKSQAVQEAEARA